MTGGVWDLPWWGCIVYTLIVTHISIVAVTVYLHRCQAHRAIELHPSISHFFRFWLWLTTAMVTSQWAAVHRKHHALVETPEDPHSPQIVGIKKVLLEGAELYRAEARNPAIVKKYGHGTPEDWLEQNIYSRRFEFGTPLMLLIDLVLFGPLGLSIWGVQMLWIPVLAAGVVNGVGHYSGYRNYELPDASTNFMPWGIVIGGEELHNNHHAFPSSAKFSSQWWEFDIGWLYIQILCALGLARVKKLPPKPMRAAGKSAIDHDTVRALIVNRLHLMGRYADEVVDPVYHEVLRHAGAQEMGLISGAQQLIIREYPRLEPAERLALQEALKSTPALENVYRFKLRLAALFGNKTANLEALRRALTEWCEQAESAGIEPLQRFSRSLACYI
ncbi:MAG: DesA family fatty acid desaturase [Gammaproteobacteria bacterium]